MPDPIPFPARYWRGQDNGRILCELCPRACSLSDGQRGLCFVRQRRGQGMILDTYGRSSGFCVDPIEKKPLHHFLPGTPVLSFGTAGCNLTCQFCQNWDISKSRDQDRLMDAAQPQAIAQAALAAGCRSVAFTYNDPVIFLEYAVDTAAACRALGLKTVAVTAGYISPAARPEFFGVMDAANVDLKGFTPGFYRRRCSADLDAVLDTLRWMREHSRTWLEITTLLIPGENDSDAELRAECRWIREHLGPDVPLHFTAFHPDFRMLSTPATPAATLLRARRIGLAAGLRYVYTGNVHDLEGGSTFCPGCGRAVVARDWYEMRRWELQDGRCRHCGTAIAGHFEAQPGTWGARRRPLRLGAGELP